MEESTDDDATKIHRNTEASDNITSSVTDSGTQDRETLPLLESNLQDDDGDKEVLLEGQNVEESTPKSTQTPESISEPSFVEQWKKGLLSKSIRLYFPFFTCFLAIVFPVIYASVNPVKRSGLFNHLSLDCWTIHNEPYPYFNHRLITYSFLHNDTYHLINNELALLFYGIPLESIIGTPIFVALYSYLCYSISIEWYENQLVLKTCASGSVGASGVIAALASNANIITLYRLFFKAIVQYLLEPVTEKEQTIKFRPIYWIFFSIGFFFNLLTSLILNVVLLLNQILNDQFNATEGVANDIHLLGNKKGSFGDLYFPQVPFCLFWDLFEPILRIGYDKLSEKIMIILHDVIPFLNNPIKYCIEFCTKCYTKFSGNQTQTSFNNSNVN